MNLKSVCILFSLLLLPAISRAAREGVPVYQGIETVEDAATAINDLAEEFLPNSGGDDIFSIDRQNNQVLISTLSATHLIVNQTASTSSFIIKDGGTKVFEMYDGGIFDTPKQSSVFAYRSGAYNVGTTEAIIAFETEGWDNQNEFNTTTSSFTATRSGRYYVSANYRLDSPTDQSRLTIAVKLDGSNVLVNSNTASGTLNCGVHVCGLVNITANSTLAVHASNSGGTETGEAGASLTYLSIQKVD